MNKLTRDQRVLKFLQENETMNYMDALFTCKTSRLSAAIFNLRKDYDITTKLVAHKNTFGELETVAQYKLIA
jgi:hypothetical protein|tara:strand:+ start:652 stop:867 length:216 start_codon:yes stop_codon:yes gene_type:complete